MLVVATIVLLVVATLAPKDKKKTSKKQKKALKIPKNGSPDKSETKETPKQSVSSTQNADKRPSVAPNGQIRNLNNRQNLRR